MKICYRAILALVCLSGTAKAGNLEATLSEPEVVNFRTVATALWEERSTYYVGFHLNRHGTNLPGTLWSTLRGTEVGPTLSFPGGLSGFTPGVVFGARRMAYDFIFGAELRYNAAPGATINTVTFGEAGGGLLPPGQTTTFQQRTRISSDSGLRLVFGREFSGMRLYGAIGMSAASVTTSVSSDAPRAGADPTPIGELPSQTRNMVGLHWALGMEVQVNRQMSVRVEYSETNFGSFAYDPLPSELYSNTHSISASSQRLTLGAIFEF